ncbi:MAG: hypothetical protein Athens041674_273 [Parcubacteria group bacterium Athens0416_74]|nr:MAG: hypothetical protein Athens041674_273 [Parcubacteria group bacterium Athens0416_74]
MNEKITQIFENLKRESLTESERALMRNQLLMHMSEHPARAPFSVRLLDGLSTLSDAFGPQQFSNYRFVPATLAMVFVVGLGTAYAAEGALPGEPLYAVKLNVNESVKGALAVSDASEASWHTEKLERRLVEAEVLVAEGKLTPVAQAQLESEIEDTVVSFDAHVEKLSKSDGEAAVAAVQSDLEASLIGHAEVLVALSSSDDDDGAAQPIIRSILSKAEAAQASRASHEAALVATRDGKDIREAALKKKQKAKEVVLSVRSRANSALVQSTTTADVARESAEEAERSITHAEDAMEEGDYGSAFSNFQEAIRAVKTVEVHMDASERLKTDVRIFTRSRPDTESASMMMKVEPTEDDHRE